jgi:hypothetical protein
MAAKWTFMVYIAGFNNLSPFAATDLDEMRRVGSTDDVKVAVFIKQLGTGARHLLLGKTGEGEQSEELGNVDSGNPQTLLDFVRWAVRTAPADRYALVVWNHGSGWQPDDLDQLYQEVRARRGDTGVTQRELGVRSTQQIARSLFSTTVQHMLELPSAGERAIASDDGTGHSLDTIELNKVVKRASEEALGGPLALLGMDACLMSTFEVAYEVEEYVAAVVGSEELEPGDGWPYTEILQDLTANPDMAGTDLGGVVVERYVQSYQDLESQWPVTQCAVDSAQTNGFIDQVDALARALGDHLNQAGDNEKVTRALARSVAFMGDLVDLGTFCSALQAGPVEQEVKDAAGRVLEALHPGGYVVAESHLGPTVEGCRGITLYFPPPLTTISKFYGDLRFAQRGWDDFLHSYQRTLRGD